MRWLRVSCLLIIGAGVVSNAAGQATGLPSFNAPYRAFRRSEIGLVLSFPNGGGTAFEGAFRRSSGKFDIGFRGGIYTPGGNLNSRLLLGAEARERVVTHTEDFPLDGALILGIGAQLSSGNSVVSVPRWAGGSIPGTPKSASCPTCSRPASSLQGTERRISCSTSGSARISG